MTNVFDLSNYDFDSWLWASDPGDWIVYHVGEHLGDSAVAEFTRESEEAGMIYLVQQRAKRRLDPAIEAEQPLFRFIAIRR